MMNKERILIVEDDPIIRSNLTEMLEIEGFSTFQSMNGKEAMILLKSKKVTLILTDWIMPEMDGLKLLELLKTNPSFSHIPVIMLTAKMQLDDKLKALQLGADDFLTKPFSSKELYLRCRNAIINRKTILSKSLLDEESLNAVSKDEQFINKLRDFISKNYATESITLSDFTDYFHMSISNFQKSVKRITGKSAFDLLFEQRLIKANDLLSSNACRITEAAFQCGFKNTYYFTKKFKKYYGVVPSKVVTKNETQNTNS